MIYNILLLLSPVFLWLGIRSLKKQIFLIKSGVIVWGKLVRFEEVEDSEGIDTYPAFLFKTLDGSHEEFLGSRFGTLFYPKKIGLQKLIIYQPDNPKKTASVFSYYDIFRLSLFYISSTLIALGLGIGHIIFCDFQL